MNARSILLSLSLFCCFTAGGGGFLYFQQTASSSLHREEESIQTTASLIAVKIDTALEDYVKVVNTMATLPDVISAMSTEQPAVKIKSKYLLYQFCNQAVASICYLLKPDGDVLLDNRGPDEKTLEGKNYSFRPYFADALKSGGAIYAALGTLTLKRGIYFSRRIENEYFETLGVGVMKVPMDGLIQLMNNLPGTVILINPDGVVFSSTRSDWLFKSLWPVKADRMNEIVGSQQFGQEALEDLGFNPDISARRLISIDGESEYIVGEADINRMEGWKLLYIKAPESSLDIGIVPVLLSLFLLTALAALLLYRIGSVDLTRRKEAEDELASSEKRLRQLTEITSEGIVIHQQGVIIDCNNAIEEIFGKSRDQLIGYDIWSLMEPECVGIAVQHMMDGYEQPYDVEGRRSDGEVFPMEICARDSEMRGQDIRVCCIRDMSQTQQLIAERIHRAIDHAEAIKSSFAVIYIDLDNFKRFNDSLGHQFGDMLLTATARRLRSGLTEKDSLIRHGGDEFIVLLGDIRSSAQMCESVDRLNKLFKEAFKINQRSVNLSATFGVALYPNHGEVAKVLLQNAEIAMHRCREEGLQGQYALYSEKMSYEAGQRLELEQHLRKAIDRNELYLNYQPVYSLQGEKLCLASAEVLVRWDNSELGFIGPDKFIPIAEDTGLIMEIGDWILRQACMQGALWLQQGLPPFRLAINISPRQLQQPSFVDDLHVILKETGFPESQLCLEITEGTLIEDDQYARVVLNKLKDLGISLSMDDFGTGYSSLSYLKDYPFDFLKIDRTFVMGLETEHSYQQLVKACLLMAQGLSLDVIAEGIETKEQFQFLETLSCDYYQGYLFNKPLAARDFERHLDSLSACPDGMALDQFLN